ncbi:transcription termination/antitermination protein NusG [Tropicimonas sp. IMCC34043]|uniref:transcription termination/antitermination protein NusG n=1 Tax=Tropicimonas sp. IMCC34043 TaxID=2248760 RepID=UPI0013007318|nr:transcription termination/antitermination NusG family protein [Tropicimonas sp. IMCC34043]
MRGTGHREFLPEVVLRRAGFEVFLPVKKVWRRKSRVSAEKVLIRMPLVPGWIFVGIDGGVARWADLMATGVVAGVIGTGGRPLRVGLRVILDLMRRWGGREGADRRRLIRRSVKIKRSSWRNLRYEMLSSGGDVALKYFRKRETKAGVVANLGALRGRVLFPRTFFRGGKFPSRVDIDMGGHVYDRLSERRFHLKKVRSGVFIPRTWPTARRRERSTRSSPATSRPASITKSRAICHEILPPERKGTVPRKGGSGVRTARGSASLSGVVKS